MTYASLEDLVERAGMDEIVQVADRDGDLIPDPEVIGAALIHADNLANGYLAGRYTLPFSTVPDLLRTWATAIARYHLHRDGAPEYVTADYKDALAGLRDVQRGAISLPLPSGGEPAATSAGDHLSASPRQVFTDDFLRGWR